MEIIQIEYCGSSSLIGSYIRHMRQKIDPDEANQSKQKVRFLVGHFGKLLNISDEIKSFSEMFPEVELEVFHKSGY